MSELTKNVKPLEDFNWDEFENGTVANVSKEELDKAYDETLNKVADHQVVDGKVISVDKKEVVVNIGYKSDGIIPAGEFRYNPELKEGDTVEVYVEFVKEYTHKKGALAAARKGDVANPMKESSGSQFYIVQDERACAQLDGGYTVYGETIKGLDIIDRIAKVATDSKDRPVMDVRIETIQPSGETAEIARANGWKSTVTLGN